MTEAECKRVAAWMAAHVAGFSGSVTAIKFDVGQSNPTYLLCAGSGRYVLRRKPPGQLLKSAHAVDREFRVQRPWQTATYRCRGFWRFAKMMACWARCFT